jgi:8-oxo-dGTP diphosphatase
MPHRKFRNPFPTVDIIIEIMEGRRRRGVVLIERKNPPPGWALPGGFVDLGETLEAAAAREALEETGLAVRLGRQFHTYSEPARDARRHTISTVFLAEADGVPRGGDDAAEARVFAPDALPPLAFDHAQILADYVAGRY